MTKEYLKMADVFTDEVKSDSDYLLNNELGEIANFSGYKNECRYAAHAINSHDELVAEVERLREHLTQVKALCSHLAECGGWDVNSYSEYANANVE